MASFLNLIGRRYICRARMGRSTVFIAALSAAGPGVSYGFLASTTFLSPHPLFLLTSACFLFAWSRLLAGDTFLGGALSLFFLALSIATLELSLMLAFTACLASLLHFGRVRDILSYLRSGYRWCYAIGIFLGALF